MIAFLYNIFQYPEPTLYMLTFCKDFVNSLFRQKYTRNLAFLYKNKHITRFCTKDICLKMFLILTDIF